MLKDFLLELTLKIISLAEENKMKKTKSFQRLQQKTMVHLQRNVKLSAEEVDMLDYINESRKFAGILDKLAEKIINKWNLIK